MKRKFSILGECLRGVPTKDALPLIKEAGFDSYSTDCYTSEEVATFKSVGDSLGMACEFIHAPFRGVNNMWLSGMDYLEIYRGMEEAIDTAAEFGIPCVIIHVSSGWNSPQVNDLGLARYDALVLHALDLGVKIAFENLRNKENVLEIMERYKDRDHVKYCYDCGHEHCYTENVDWVSIFGDKLACVHVHDNFGYDRSCDPDVHYLPFDGNLDYADMVRRLDAVGYTGPIMLEVFNTTKPEYKAMTQDEFFSECAKRAKKIAEMGI